MDMAECATAEARINECLSRKDFRDFVGPNDVYENAQKVCRYWLERHAPIRGKCIQLSVLCAKIEALEKVPAWSWDWLRFSIFLVVPLARMGAGKLAHQIYEQHRLEFKDFFFEHVLLLSIVLEKGGHHSEAEEVEAAAEKILNRKADLLAVDVLQLSAETLGKVGISVPVFGKPSGT